VTSMPCRPSRAVAHSFRRATSRSHSRSTVTGRGCLIDPCRREPALTAA
jgi:hypothetical protein